MSKKVETPLGASTGGGKSHAQTTSGNGFGSSENGRMIQKPTVSLNLLDNGFNSASGDYKESHIG